MSLATDRTDKTDFKVPMHDDVETFNRKKYEGNNLLKTHFHFWNADYKINIYRDYAIRESQFLAFLASWRFNNHHYITIYRWFKIRFFRQIRG